MKRRDFLRTLTGTAIGVGSLLLEHPFQPRVRIAQGAPTNGKTLVCVFQRGGCDGLNMIVPYGDDDYYSLRTNIAIPAPGSGQANRAIALGDGFFGLHPSLQPLKAIWDNGDIAFIPTVGYDNASLSHFTGQDRIERADGVNGWLNRHLASSEPPGSTNNLLRAAAISTSLPQALRGEEIVSVINDINNFAFDFPNSISEESVEGFLNRLVEAYAQESDPGQSPPRPNRELVHAFGSPLFNDLGIVNNINVPPVPDLYRQGQQSSGRLSTFARQMYHTALLIKAGVGLELACVDVGGWDTHSDQGNGFPEGRQAQRLADLATGIKGFYDDLSASGHMQNIALLTLTEFGRTAQENGSMGTDHGNAWAACVVGGGNPKSLPGGGQIYTGQNPTRPAEEGWPGLSEEKLYRGRYLMHTIDYRSLMGELLVEHLGRNVVDLENLLPGYVYNPTGFMSSS